MRRHLSVNYNTEDNLYPRRIKLVYTPDRDFKYPARADASARVLRYNVTLAL